MRVVSSGRRDVPTQVLGKMSLTHVGILAVAIEPVMDDCGARETARAVLEEELCRELRTLHAAFGGDAGEDGEKLIRVIAASSDTFVVLAPRRYVEATKMVCAAARMDKTPITIREVVVCEGSHEMDVLRRVVPMLIEGAFAETPDWRAFGENDSGTRYMFQDFWPAKPGMMVTACGVEIEHGIAVAKAPTTLDRDVGEDRELDIVFPSINTVILRLQRIGSIIDAMRDAGVSNQKLRDFIAGDKVIDISSTPIMAQAAPEIGIEVGIIAFRREMPHNAGFKTIAEFRLAFGARFNTFVPTHAHVDDSETELLADVCFPGHDAPYLWPVSLLLKNTGATELTARSSNVTNDTLLAWLFATTQVPILETHLSFQVNRKAFMSQNIAPKCGPLIPDREIFMTASQTNKTGWPAFSAQANSMPYSIDAWVNPFSHVDSFPPVAPNIFSPHQMVPINTTSTPSSVPPSVKTPGGSDFHNVFAFDDLLIDRAKDLSPARIAELTHEIAESGDEDQEPVLGSRLTPGGIRTATFSRLQGELPQKRSPAPVTKIPAKKRPSGKRRKPNEHGDLQNRIATACKKKIGEVPDEVVDVCALIEANDLESIKIRTLDKIGFITMVKKLIDAQSGDNPKSRSKEHLVSYTCEKLKLKKAVAKRKR